MVAKMELRKNNNNNNSWHSSLKYCSCRGKNTIAKKQNSFPLLIHPENIKLAGAQGLGTGEGAGEIQEPFAVLYRKRRHFVSSHFHFLLHVVPHGFFMFWSNQQRVGKAAFFWSIESRLGVFKQNIQDKLKVLIHFRAVSHTAHQCPGCVAVKLYLLYLQLCPGLEQG